MALDVGIVGPPGSGKTTLFTALTGVRPEGYGTPHIGIAPIADERLAQIAEVVGSAKQTPATIRLIDVPGTAAAQLGGVRRADALLAVVRDPGELPSLELELLVADQDHVERRLERMRKEAKSGDPAMIAGYCGNSATLDEAIAKFALAYARQTEQDHAQLDKARRAGRITVAAGKVV